jgi:protein-S-isoprenylcysteine O-methyltransferase Ste14
MLSVIIIFIFYFIIFAAFHSFLATDHIKKKAEKRLKYQFRFYRIFYNFISIIIFAPVLLIWIMYTTSTLPVYNIPNRLYPFIFLIRLAAIGLFSYAAYQTDVLDFSGIRQITGKSKNILITKGAYGIVRHPLYTGGIIVLFTKTHVTQLDLTAFVLISLYFIVGALLEEKRLISILGEEYRKYQQDVSMFIPVKWILKKLN